MRNKGGNVTLWIHERDHKRKSYAMFFGFFAPDPQRGSDDGARWAIVKLRGDNRGSASPVLGSARLLPLWPHLQIETEPSTLTAVLGFFFFNCVRIFINKKVDLTLHQMGSIANKMHQISFRTQLGELTTPCILSGKKKKEKRKKVKVKAR